MPHPDTIVAIGTPPGASALAVVRISGSGARGILKGLCPDLPQTMEPRRAVLARALDPATGEGLDQLLVTTFHGPDSYTGEDLVELSCHGGWLSPALILEACLGSGARLAEEGLSLSLTYEAVAFLVEHGFDEKFGARPLRRAIQRYLEDPLSEKILL